MLLANVLFCAAYWIRNRSRFAFLIVLMIFYAALLVSSPLMLSGVMNSILTDTSSFSLNIVIMLTVFVATTFARLLITRVWNDLEIENISVLTEDLFSKALSMGIVWYSTSKSGAVLRILSRGHISYHAFGDLIFQRLGISLLVAIFTVIVAFGRSIPLGVIFLLGIVTYSAASLWFGARRVLPDKLRAVQADSALSGEIGDALGCLPYIKMSATEDAEIARLASYLGRWSSATRRSWRSNLTAEALQDGALLLLKCMLISSAAVAIITGRSDPGEFVFLVSTFFVLETQLSDLARSFQQVTRNAADIQELREFVTLDGDAPHQGSNCEEETEERRREGDAVEFRNVSFAYNEETPVIKNVSLAIPPGRSVAVVGPSGGGKTTLINLMLGLLVPNTGGISVYGRDLSEMPSGYARVWMATVPQDPTIFDRTILENVSYLSKFHFEHPIHFAAIQRSNLTELFERDGLTLDSKVGPRGVRLSGGQRQRLAIARALASERPIMLFDEATSALDAGNEEDILDRLVARPSRTTTIVVTHRVAALRKVDHVLLVREGKITFYQSPQDFLDHHIHLVTSTAEDLAVPSEKNHRTMNVLADKRLTMQGK